MFGFQRVHDLAWAAGDARSRGFLLGATSGRTTLNGEGLQHQDGHSHIFAQTIPNCKSYDPCFDYELSTIIKSGIEDMYVQNNDNYYYITLMNENYTHPARPKNATAESIMKGAYKYLEAKEPEVRILASGVTLRFAERAKEILNNLGFQSEVWSITSFNELTRGGIDSDRKKFIGKKESKAYVKECFEKELPTVAVSEYMRSYSEQIRKWVTGDYLCLGTDGYGRSDTRKNLRSFFEIDENFIVYACLLSLKKEKIANNFAKENNMKFNTKNPWEI